MSDKSWKKSQKKEWFELSISIDRLMNRMSLPKELESSHRGNVHSKTDSNELVNGSDKMILSWQFRPKILLSRCGKREVEQIQLIRAKWMAENDVN